MNLFAKFSLLFACLSLHLNIEAMQNPLQNDDSELKVITFNVWFDVFARDLRNEEILRLVKINNPDIACFQEVTFSFFDAVRGDQELLDAYDLSLDPASSVDQVNCYLGEHAYGVLMLVKKDLKARFLITKFTKTQMARRVLTAEITKNARKIMIATSHLESMDYNSQVRATQLGEIKTLCANSSDLIITGDFNLSVKDNRQLLAETILQDFLDVWPLLYPTAVGHTFDSVINRMINSSQRMRYDRVFYKSGANLSAKNMEIIGDRPFAFFNNNPLCPIFASDHYGLCAVFIIK